MILSLTPAAAAAAVATTCDRDQAEGGDGRGLHAVCTRMSARHLPPP